MRLKECYPYASDIQRVGTDLIWADIATATNDKVAFTTAYHKLLDFQNTTKLRNSTAHIFDLCEAEYSAPVEHPGRLKLNTLVAFG